MNSAASPHKAVVLLSIAHHRLALGWGYCCYKYCTAFALSTIRRYFGAKRLGICMRKNCRRKRARAMIRNTRASVSQRARGVPRKGRGDGRGEGTWVSKCAGGVTRAQERGGRKCGFLNVRRARRQRRGSGRGGGGQTCGRRNER